VIEIRPMGERWARLSALVAWCEKLLESNARLDAHQTGTPGDRTRAERSGRTIGLRLDALAAQIEQELDRLTVERLDADLTRKRARIRARIRWVA
jgi:hypothetical protein